MDMHGGYGGGMMNPGTRLFCRLDGLSTADREQRRSRCMGELGLLDSESIPVFEEATQMATHFLDMPISLLGVMEAQTQRIKAAVGLSRLGPMNDLAKSRQFPRLDSFCTYVVDSHQILAIADTFAHRAFEASALVHQYGIRAYLGVPLLAANGCCVGTLAVMTQHPRDFSQQDIEFLQLTARWSMSEFERQRAGQSAPSASRVANAAATAAVELAANPPAPAAPQSAAHQLKLELLAQLTQELRTPLTSVMGMASVLMREIYGPLTGKQKEYLDIIHNSGQYLLSLVNEILELSALKDGTADTLDLTSVDIEMLSQQAIGTLEQTAHRRDQKIRLSVEPGNRIWLLDREKMRQLLYHLLFSVIQSSNAGSVVRLHLSRKGGSLNLATWVSHPWLGEGLVNPSRHLQPALVGQPVLVGSGAGSSHEWEDLSRHGVADALRDMSKDLAKGVNLAAQESSSGPTLRDQTCSDLGLLLCRQLAELHGGQLTVQKTSEAGYRYVVILPPQQGTVA
jgi:signal transduction histidine kinase